MAKIKRIPCLVVNSEGDTSINLEKGAESIFCYPKWKCTKVECLIRTQQIFGEVGAAYRSLNVGLGTRNKYMVLLIVKVREKVREGLHK